MSSIPFLLCVFLFPFFLPPKISAAEQYLDELLAASRRQRLHEKRYWDILLHYKKIFASRESLIDDPRFFLSPLGKTDPEAEMDATLGSFFQQDGSEEVHSRCKFPARFEWLQEQLDIDETRLPEVSCQELDEALEKVNPKQAVMVFPTAFMNSPASLFGHTLLRIDSGYESKLLSYAVNYAAQTDETNGLTFAMKGIFGFYKGYYSILPYYEKVKEYNNMDRRDMWEYSLLLSEDEVWNMFLHIWELKDIYSYYYFFDENCSYNILFLLEAAKPSLHLTDDFFFWVIPVDTIKILKEQGVVGDVSYRPSISTKIKELTDGMDDVVFSAAEDVAGGKEDPELILGMDTNADAKIKALDLATELIQYKYTRRKIDKETYTERFRGTLLSRSILGKGTTQERRADSPVDPIQGHGSSMFGLGGGVRDGLNFGELRYRPAYHTLLDSQEGFLEGAQIVFFGLTARYYESIGLRLEELDLLDLVSIAPRDNFFKPLSWKINVGLKTEFFSDSPHHVYGVSPAAGVAYENRLLGLCYVLLGPDFYFSDGFGKGYSFSIGTNAGISKNVSEFWKTNLFVNFNSAVLGDERDSHEITWANSLRLRHNSNLIIEYSSEKFFQSSQNEVSLSVRFYF